MPEDMALAVLAHEAGHVYMHLQGFNAHGMADRVAEGVCELWSYLWEHGRIVKEQTLERTRRQRMLHMESDPTIYGEGFRDALAAYVACGYSLPKLMARVKQTGGVLPRAGGPSLDAWAQGSGRAWLGRGGGALTAEGGVYQPLGAAPRVDTRRRARVFDEQRRATAAHVVRKDARDETEGARPRSPPRLVRDLATDFDACELCEA